MPEDGLAGCFRAILNFLKCPLARFDGIDMKYPGAIAKRRKPKNERALTAQQRLPSRSAGDSGYRTRALDQFERIGLVVYEAHARYSSQPFIIAGISHARISFFSA